jgi:hypothetical protein
LQERQGEKKVVRGTVSWEPVIAGDGSVHLLIFAGTFARNRADQEDGYWYLSIDPDGNVGGPVALAAHDQASRDFPNPRNQVRRLTLGPDGGIFLMLTGPKKASFYRLD